MMTVDAKTLETVREHGGICPMQCQNCDHQVFNIFIRTAPDRVEIACVRCEQTTLIIPVQSL